MSGLDLYRDDYTDLYGTPQPGPVSPSPVGLQALTAEGAQVVCRAEVWLDGQPQGEQQIVAGQVTYDVTSRVLRSCDVTLVGDLPEGPQHPLAPIGSELRLYRGAIDRDGSVVEEPLGRYAFDESLVERSSRDVQIAGYDYSQLVSDARWEEPYEIESGTNLAEAIAAAVQSRLPGHLWREPNMVSTTSTTPNIVWGEERDNDPWQDVTALAKADGKRLFFDRAGRLTLIDVPDPDDADIAADFTVGTSPLLTTLSRRLDGRAYNVVVATGETDDDSPPVSATVEDDNPNSPSYTGRYRRPYFMASGYITSETQAQAAARGELRRRIGLGEVVTLSVVPAPWLDVWDVIAAKDDDIFVDARYVIDSMSLPLRPGSATITTRRRRI